jgi:hypothetical protein
MSATTRAVALAGSLGLLLGAGAFWVVRGPHGRAPTLAAPHEALSAVTGEDRPGAAPLLAAAAFRSAIREEVRAAVHDEVAAATKAAGKPTPEPAAKEPSLPTHSYEQAQAHVAERLAQGSWSNADRETMQVMLRNMTDEERREVIGKVIVAANRGQLRVQLTGPLF